MRIKSGCVPTKFTRIFLASEMIAEVLTKRALFVACDLLASTPLILQNKKSVI